jgi:hypothetical protein
MMSHFACQCQNYDNPFIEKLKSKIMFVAYYYGSAIQFIRLTTVVILQRNILCPSQYIPHHPVPVWHNPLR